jgi:two-component system cell cycle sensor histidine kinase/response regulator CckA
MSSAVETCFAGRAVVIDDNDANLYYAGKLLGERGYDVTPAKGYFDALQALSKDDAALLLADIRLPSGSGLELARFARIQRPDVKILLMTAYREEELRARDLLFPVIRIPFSKRGLLSHLRRLFV